MSAVQTNQIEFAEAAQNVVRKVSRVLEVAPASPAAAFEHFAKKVTFERECADVYSCPAKEMIGGATGWVDEGFTPVEG